MQDKKEQKGETAKAPKDTSKGDGCVYFLDGGDDSLDMYMYQNSSNGTL